MNWIHHFVKGLWNEALILSSLVIAKKLDYLRWLWIWNKILQIWVQQLGDKINTIIVFGLTPSKYSFLRGDKDWFTDMSKTAWKNVLGCYF